MNFRLNKSGIIGSLITMFITTIVIIIILTVFVLGSGVVKKFDKVDVGIRIYNETEIGLCDVFDYMTYYNKFIEVKYLIEGGMELDNALMEIGYGE